jgi:hypothetical protein
MTEHIGAAPYERYEGRTDHRNGHKPGTLRARGAPWICSSLMTAKATSPRGCSCATSSWVVRPKMVSKESRRCATRGVRRIVGWRCQT